MREQIFVFKTLNFQMRYFHLFRLQASRVIDKLFLLDRPVKFSMLEIDHLAAGVQANPGRSGVVHGGMSIENIRIHEGEIILLDITGSI